MNKLDIHYLQLGSFFELYSLEDSFFLELKDQAKERQIKIKSCFTAHRELGGFFTGNSYLEKAARLNYERFIRVASLLEADYMGSNPGSVYRDRIEAKEAGIECYLKHMKELMVMAKKRGLKGLTIEPMSCLAEPPALPEEIDYMIHTLNKWHLQHPDTTVPVYICGDISHGVVDREKKAVHNNLALFEYEIPHMVEFHLKNTDAIFNTSFGFSKEELAQGIIDLSKLKEIIDRNNHRWSVDEVVGYLEIGGPKLGRDYSDFTLEKMLTDSLYTIKEVFSE